MRRDRSEGRAGFSMLELMSVVVVIMIVAGFAVPTMLSALHTARLRGSVSDYASLLQVGRLRSIQDDRFYSTYVLAGTTQQAYVDLNSNGGTGVDPGDPLVAISAEVAPVAVANAPDTANLKGQFLPTGSTLAVNDGSTTTKPVVFSPRGLPCTSQTATGGNVCDSAGGATAFWIFFQDNSTQAWEAVTVSPAGRVSRWQHGTGGLSKL